jgi:hypothetical protein
MKVDDEIKLPGAHLFDDLENPQDRQRLKSVTQANSINDQRLIGESRQSYHFGSGLSQRYRDLRAWGSLSNCANRRQAKHYIAKLSKIDYQNISRIKHLNYFTSLP